MVIVQRPNHSSILAPLALIAIVVGAVVAALVVVGSPVNERNRRSDSMRVQDLQYLKFQVDQFHKQRGRLPAKLEELKSLDMGTEILDPESRAAYSYRPLGEKDYELGATFKTDTSRESESGERNNEYAWYANRNLPFWKHASGPVTYRLKVEPPPKS